MPSFKPIPWFMGILAALIVAVIVGWTNNVASALNRHEQDLRSVVRVEAKVDMMQQQLDRIEKKLEK